MRAEEFCTPLVDHCKLRSSIFFLDSTQDEKKNDNSYLFGKRVFDRKHWPTAKNRPSEVSRRVGAAGVEGAAVIRNLFNGDF